MLQSLGLWASSLLVAVGLVGTSGAAPVYLDAVSGLEWRQAKDTVNFNFNQMNKDTNGQTWGCSASTGACSGNLGGSGASLDGWRWATELEARTLFHNFAGSLNIPGFDPLPSTPTSYTETVSIWAPAIIDSDGVLGDAGIFDATFVVAGQGAYVLGYTRTTNASGKVFAAYIQDGDIPAILDVADTSATYSRDNRVLATHGFWLFREASTVPAPATLWLLAAGVAGLGWRRRKK